MTSFLVLTSSAPLRDDLASLTCPGEAFRRLAETAVECPFDADPGPVLAAARAALGEAAVDANVVPAANREKRLLICDMDSTIIPVECIDEIAAVAGVGPRVAAITERAMRGELDFEAALRERVGLLAGLPEATLEAVYDERVTLNPGAADLARGMNERGALTALVSGGFTFFTSRVAEAAGFARHQANDLLIEEGLLTGEPGEPILGAAAKLEALERLSAEIGARPADAVAVGDGANDLEMIRAAGLGVAYRAKPAVAAAADARLDHSDLSAVLRLQGIAASGFG